MNKQKKMKVVLVVVLVGTLMSACTVSQATETRTSEKDVEGPSRLELLIVPEQEVYRDGDAVIVTLVLKNTGNATIRVNNRMTANLFKYPKSLWDVAFLIWDKSGELTQRMWINKKLPDLKTYVDLAPNSQVEEKYDLSSLYNLSSSVKKGEFTIQAVYQNQEAPSGSIGIWQGEIKSDPVSIVIQ